MRKKLKLMSFIVLSILLLSGCTLNDNNGDNNSGSNENNNNNNNIEEYRYIETDIKLANHLYVINSSSIKSDEEYILVESLQGIVAQKEASIYLDVNNAYTTWLKTLANDYGITYEYVENVWELLDIFKDQLNGYVLYTHGTDSVNVACTYAGLNKVLVVDTSLENRVEKYGLKMVDDLRFKDTEWIINTYGNAINWDYVIQQDPSNISHRDFGIALRGLYFYNHYTWLGAEEFEKMGKDSPMLGWGPTDEGTDVSFLSENDIITLPTNHSWNMSIFASKDLKNTEGLTQIADRSFMETDESKHYVAFMLSDGDNIQWMMGDYYVNEDTYANPSRGDIPFGWSVAPLSVDVAPSILKEYYDNATTNDYFFAGVSGSAYFFPELLSKEALELTTSRLNDYFDLLDLDYANIMVKNTFKNDPSILDYYSDKSNIKGGLLSTYNDKYEQYNGQVWWSNDKPFLAVRDALWEIDDLDAFASKINDYDVNPYSIDGYTLVVVHTWSHSYDDVLEVVSKFDDHVEVVSPFHLMDLINRNVPHENAVPSK